MTGMSHSRRKFARSLAAVGAALPLTALAQKHAEAAQPIAAAQAGLIRAHYGRHLDDEELARIAKNLESTAVSVERLRSFKLTNADEPDFTFAAQVERW